ncbi:hypothetical protein BpHYR1_020950 [Brachionus plicatilis]|uniref:Uncharacterized protein n=1 Tax=Brachionus plicatilis TaxID=10195 RepID=A0A3M7RSX2_BRAPC|nr:hypothetical protein BpHYR1_020950 [Brachionus plicatilis]
MDQMLKSLRCFHLNQETAYRSILASEEAQHTNKYSVQKDSLHKKIQKKKRKVICVYVLVLEFDLVINNLVGITSLFLKWRTSFARTYSSLQRFTKIEHSILSLNSDDYNKYHHDFYLKYLIGTANFQIICENKRINFFTKMKKKIVIELFSTFCNFETYTIHDHLFKSNPKNKETVSALKISIYLND